MHDKLLRRWCIAPLVGVTLVSSLSNYALAQICSRDYLIINDTNTTIIGFFLKKNNMWSDDLLGVKISPQKKGEATINGGGRAQYSVKLSSGEVVEGFARNICAFSQITIYYDNSNIPQMEIK